MAAFLWNVRGDSRCQWINWKTICKPIEEGGLGLWSLGCIFRPLKACITIQRISLERPIVKVSQITPRRGPWCKWDRPSPGWVKLNIDG